MTENEMYLRKAAVAQARVIAATEVFGAPDRHEVRQVERYTALALASADAPEPAVVTAEGEPVTV